MFRNRQSSQKPPDELFERFRSTFPGVRTTTASEEQSHTNAVAGGISTLEHPRFGHEHEDLDPTPRAPTESFRFTPSLLDPNSAAFAAFVNQTPGLFTPTPGGANTTFSTSAITNAITTQHNDLQTPNIGITIGSPLSMSGGGTIAPPTTDGQFAAPQTIQPHQFHNYQPFSQSLHPQYLDPSQYDTRPPSGPGSPMDTTGAPDMMQHPIGLGNVAAGLATGPLSVPLDGEQFENQVNHDMHMLSSSERFRFHVVLNAPTAMIKHPDEIPVTYLNKGQAYAISIADTMPSAPSNGLVRYRTFIRISFHDETQRTRPASCWQLWKEGRGTSEAHQRGGKLQAVEYVENAASGDDEKKKKARVELESSSFDCFCVTWAPSPSGAAETSVSVRFNFLSTDFSHSKGVKGIPVRLCAKTEILTAGSPPRTTPEASEICYCKVKLFRDHGAERKLANDVLHVKKTIEKLRQQASQLEGSGIKVFGKKSKKEVADDMSKPGKAPKHKRTWSMSSASSVVGGRSQEDDTNAKLQNMQDMFSSTKPISVLYLRGEEEDDPDLYPVRLVGDPADTDDAWASRRLSVTTNTTASSFVSPTPSSASLNSQRGDHYSSSEKDWDPRGYQNLSHSGPADIPIRIKTTDDPSTLSGWIEAIGIDSTYVPPAERPIKAVMCIYILPVVAGESQNALHRAVYLQSRTAASLTNSIASKCGIDPAAVVRTVHVNSRGINIIVDDDFVSQMNEGQDMKVQATEVQEAPSLPQNWVNAEMHEEDTKPQIHRGWELQLVY